MHENCMVLNGVCVTSLGLNNSTEYYKLKSTGSDLDRSRLTDTRSAENDWIGADTDPPYRIDASLHFLLGSGQRTGMAIARHVSRTSRRNIGPQHQRYSSIFNCKHGVLFILVFTKPILSVCC